MDAPASPPGLQRLHPLDDGEGPVGWIAIDSTIAGRARGGLRMASDATADEVQRAARSMTLKYGLLGLPQGGAKAAIRADPDAEPGERRHHLRRFAQAAERFLRGRGYVPDADMGTDTGDVRWIMNDLDIPIGPREWRANRSGEYTATSSVAAAAACLDQLGESYQGMRIAIQGFGKVGVPLAVRLHRLGARVVAVSTSKGALFDGAGVDVEQLAMRSRELGSRCIEPPSRGERIQGDTLLELDVGVLFLCARQDAIHEANVSAIQAKVVCSGANNGVHPAAEQFLADRGVLVPPDFVANCGGVLGGTLEFAGVSPERIDAFIEARLRPHTTALLDEAYRTRRSARETAEATALARHARIRLESERPGVVGRARALVLEGYRRGLVPEFVVQRAARPLMKRWMA